MTLIPLLFSEIFGIVLTHKFMNKDCMEGWNRESRDEKEEVEISNVSHNLEDSKRKENKRCILTAFSFRPFFCWSMAGSTPTPNSITIVAMQTALYVLCRWWYQNNAPVLVLSRLRMK